MSHSRLNESVACRPIEHASAPEFERLVAEVCARLVEMWELNHARTFKWLRRVLAISQLQGEVGYGEPALYWYLLLQSGDYAAITDSLTAMGARNNRTKQAVQQEMERATDDLVRLYPELAKAMHELRASIRSYTP